MDVLMFLLWNVGPGLAGAAMMWFAGKSRGKNAKLFFQYGAWGFWLFYLHYLAFLIPIPILGYLLMLVPSVICFMLAAGSILKEMRAQKDGEYTEAA